MLPLLRCNCTPTKTTTTQSRSLHLLKTWPHTRLVLPGVSAQDTPTNARTHAHIHSFPLAHTHTLLLSLSHTRTHTHTHTLHTNKRPEQTSVQRADSLSSRHPLPACLIREMIYLPIWVAMLHILKVEWSACHSLGVSQHQKKLLLPTGYWSDRFPLNGTRGHLRLRQMCMKAHLASGSVEEGSRLLAQAAGRERGGLVSIAGRLRHRGVVEQL